MSASACYHQEVMQGRPRRNTSSVGGPDIGKILSVDAPESQRDQHVVIWILTERIVC
jgi:hypothetical protein